MNKEIHYNGPGEHSIKELEKIAARYEELKHEINSGKHHKIASQPQIPSDKDIEKKLLDLFGFLPADKHEGTPFGIDAQGQLKVMIHIQGGE